MVFGLHVPEEGTSCAFASDHLNLLAPGLCSIARDVSFLVCVLPKISAEIVANLEILIVLLLGFPKG